MRFWFIIFMFIGLIACSPGSVPETSNSNTANNPNAPDNQGPNVGNLLPPSFPELGNPSISENFIAASTNFKIKKSIPDGSIQFGIINTAASDSKIAQLSLPGHPEYHSNDFTSPPGVQLESTQSFSFGTFRAHFLASDCAQTNEGVIHGIFTYWNDGSDLNSNGMIDNSEIDIEISCDSPNTLFLTLWTDYTDDSHFLKVTRQINLSTGSYNQTSSGEENTWELNDSGQLSSWPSTQSIGQWLDMGFTWSSTKVEYFLYYNNTRYVLWTYQNAEHIPQHAAPFLFNIWHTPSLWSNGGVADYPSAAVSLNIDTFSYFAP